MSVADDKQIQNGAPRPGDVIASKYEVERVLGAGGMGIVVAARHLQLGQRVAMKVLRRDTAGDSIAAARFLREARAAFAVRSEHVARVLDVGTLETGAPFMVMEYLDGVDLAERLRRDGEMSVAEAVETILQACEAIAEAHALGIVHRDLKPSNIFLTRRADGSRLVKVLDFGISKPADSQSSASSDQSLTASGHVVGSPGYMSPEQLRSVKAADRRSDVWALGVILYELLTAVAPFRGETLGDTVAKVVAESPPSIRSRSPEVPVGLDELVMRCLERDVARRVQTVAELARALLPYAPASALSVERIVRVASRIRASIDTETPRGFPAGHQGYNGGESAHPRRDDRNGRRVARAGHEDAHRSMGLGSLLASVARSGCCDSRHHGTDGGCIQAACSTLVRSGRERGGRRGCRARSTRGARHGEPIATVDRSFVVRRSRFR